MGHATRRLLWGSLTLAVLGVVLVAAAATFGPPQVAGEVVQRRGEPGDRRALVRWVQPTGELRAAEIVLPQGHSASASLPLRLERDSPRVGGGRLQLPPSDLLLLVTLTGVILGAATSGAVTPSPRLRTSTPPTAITHHPGH